MGKRKFEEKELNQLDELQTVIKRIRYHYDMMYIDGHIIYGHSFLDFEEALIILHSEVDLSAYDQLAGHVGDMYDAIKDMKKTRTTVRKNDRRVDLYDEKINKTMELLKINNEQRTQIFDEWYKHLDILKDALNYDWHKFPEDGIININENKSYDLIIEKPNKIVTLAKESIPLIKPNQDIYYTNVSKYDSDGLFHTVINMDTDIMNIYILVAAFPIPE